MAFIHASAPKGARNSEALSADNARPDRFMMMDIMRRAAPALRLGPSVIATLDALLSCLPPKRNHDLVFASNATLVMRRNGISDRTLRRHLAELIDAGLLIRFDSPNGKRYAKRDPEMGSVLRFGLDLSPLFLTFNHLHSLAHAQTVASQRNAYLRSKLRSLVNRQLLDNGDDAALSDTKLALRRKLTNEELEKRIAALQHNPTSDRPTYSERPSCDDEMSASNGQNVRQQQNSEKELIDKEQKADASPAHPLQATLTLDTLAEACPHATGYLPERLETPLDIVTHAKRLAPMMGVDRSCYEAAEERHGPFGAALTIWGLLEMQDSIRQLGAYFRSVTTGKRSSEFCPWQLIDRLVKRSERNNSNCPRTTTDAAFAR